MCLGGFCGVSLNKDNLIKTSRLCLLFIVDTLLFRRHVRSGDTNDLLLFRAENQCRKHDCTISIKPKKLIILVPRKHETIVLSKMQQKYKIKNVFALYRCMRLV